MPFIVLGRKHVALWMSGGEAEIFVCIEGVCDLCMCECVYLCVCMVLCVCVCVCTYVSVCVDVCE